MSEHPVIVLGISPKAGKALQYVIEQMDGYVEDEADAAILDDIHAQIEEQMPRKSKVRKGR